MLTISISDSLAGNPEGWSEWTGDTGHMYMPGLGLEQNKQMPWGAPYQTEESQLSPWQVPSQVGLEKPASSWASPLRVPLPDPIHEKRFCEETLDLPPHLSSIADQFSDLDPAWPQESKYFQPAPVLQSAPVLQTAPVPPGLAAEQPLAGPTMETKKGAMNIATANTANTANDLELPPGIKIFGFQAGGPKCTRVEWKIDDLNGKLQASMGRPLVSPPFAALGLPNLRLMVFPDGREVMKNARSSERKGLYTQMIKKGPLHGALKLKADCLQCATVMTVNLIVGEVRAGPLVYDFSEQAIHGLDDFGIDWLRQVERFSGSLTVGIEILEVRPQH